MVAMSFPRIFPFTRAGVTDDYNFPSKVTSWKRYPHDWLYDRKATGSAWVDSNDWDHNTESALTWCRGPMNRFDNV